MQEKKSTFETENTSLEEFKNNISDIVEMENVKSLIRKVQNSNLDQGQIEDLLSTAENSIDPPVNPITYLVAKLSEILENIRKTKRGNA